MNRIDNYTYENEININSQNCMLHFLKFLHSLFEPMDMPKTLIIYKCSLILPEPLAFQ